MIELLKSAGIAALMLVGMYLFIEFMIFFTHKLEWVTDQGPIAVVTLLFVLMTFVIWLNRRTR